MRKKRLPLNKKSMPWKTTNTLFVYSQCVLLSLFALFFLAGCASKPWSDPLGSTETDSALQLVDDLASREAACGKTLEGDLVLFYQTPLEKKALSGFLQFSMPSSYKFVMTNPFGQPILAFAGNQESFQAINTLNKSYISGSLRSFGLRNNIPDIFLKGNWGFMLTGRNQLSGQAIADIRYDRDKRGIWLTFPNTEKTGVSHLLLDRDKEVFLVSILEDADGQTVAEISYDNWVTIGKCKQPLDISIAGLDYGTEIQIKLSNVSTTDEKTTYRLQQPSGFRRQYMP